MTQIVLLNNKTYEVKESPEQIKASISDRGFIILQSKYTYDGHKPGTRFNPIHVNVNHITTMREWK